MEEILQGLNEEQLRAVTATEGFIRVIAGAGSGKTRALSCRFAYLVNEVGILPGNIHHYNSADIEHQYALTLKYGGVSYLVQQINGGAYELYRNSVIYKKFDDEKALLDYFDTNFELR